MAVMDWIWAGIAVIAALGGLVALYRAWTLRMQPALIFLGWGLCFLASVLAIIANGDRGFAQVLVIGMCAVSLRMLAPVMSGASGMHQKLKSARKPQTLPENARTGALSVLENIWTSLLAGPCAGIMAIFCGALLFRLTRPVDGNPATAAIAAMMLSVLLWAVFSVLLLMESRTWRRTFYALTGSLLSVSLSFLPI